MPNAISLRPNQISTYTRYARSAEKVLGLDLVWSSAEKLREKRKPAAKNKRKTNEISPVAQKRFKRAVNWLCFLSQKRDIVRPGRQPLKDFQISFITLTLPGIQGHSHSEITKKCLNRFLVDMRRYCGVSNYVWKAELQKTGKIHFHLTFDKYVHYMIIRRYWNRAINVLGYVDRYERKFSGMTEQEYIAYRSQDHTPAIKKLKAAYKFGCRSKWRSPNTTDVKKTKNVKNLAAYLAKYLAKKTDKSKLTDNGKASLETLTGRLWFCSQSISRLKSAVIPYSSQIQQIISNFRRAKTVFQYTNEWCECLFFQLGKLPKMLREWLTDRLLAYANSQNYPQPAPRYTGYVAYS